MEDGGIGTDSLESVISRIKSIVAIDIFDSWSVVVGGAGSEAEKLNTLGGVDISIIPSYLAISICCSVVDKAIGVGACCVSDGGICVSYIYRRNITDGW